MIVKRQKKTPPIATIVIMAAAFYFGLRLGTLMQANGGKLTFEVLNEASNQLLSFAPIDLSRQTLMMGFFFAIFAFMVAEVFKSQTKKNMQEEAFGSAKWEDPAYTQKMRDKDYMKNMIFTSTEIVSKDMKVTGLNRNCTILGRPGSGKSRFWLKPNLLSSMNETIIITDPKAELLQSCGNALLNAGYEIKVLNLESKWKSDHYNPLKYIRKLPKDAYLIDVDNRQSFDDDYKAMDESDKQAIAEDDVMTLIDTIMKNTKSEVIESNTGDPFWEKAEMVFLQAIFYYVIFNHEMKDRNFKTILELIRLGEPDDKGNSQLRMMFDAWERKDPDNIGIKQWKHFVVSAKSPKMMSTIIMTASARLAPFNLREINDLTIEDTMELDRIGKPGKEGNIAYFIITQPNNSTFNFIANIFYSQMFNIIDENAKANGGILATPVNVYMDEWRQLGTIPRFLENWAYVRGLNCGITIIIQSLSQFKKIYKDEWDTGLDCCDYLLFLGSSSKDTLEYMRELLGKQTLYKKSTSRTYSRQGSSGYSWDAYGRELATSDEIAKLPSGYGILHMAGGANPFYSQLYDLKKHPRYDELFEPWIEMKGESDPAFKKTSEWKENHAKLYDHVKQRGKVTTQQRQQKLMDILGIEAKVQEPFAARKLSEVQLHELRNQGGKIHSMTDFLLEEN